MHVVDVACAQLHNLAKKLRDDGSVQLSVRDSTQLRFADHSFDKTLLFFLLHEQPVDVRRETLKEAFRVTKNRIVIVDYHRPRGSVLVEGFMSLVLDSLEPFAKDLWANDLQSYFPDVARRWEMSTAYVFYDLYQIVTIDFKD
jgi:ubiquinone/menaquinone biosynthesis C-methylase UbiE